MHSVAATKMVMIVREEDWDLAWLSDANLRILWLGLLWEMEEEKMEKEGHHKLKPSQGAYMWSHHCKERC